MGIVVLPSCACCGVLLPEQCKAPEGSYSRRSGRAKISSSSKAWSRRITRSNGRRRGFRCASGRLGSYYSGDDDDDFDYAYEYEQKVLREQQKEKEKKQLDEMQAMKDLVTDAKELIGEGMDAEEDFAMKKELVRRARERSEQRKQAEVMYRMGQQAYAEGVYFNAVKILEAALLKIPQTSMLGGDIQLWLGMSYDAANRRKDCIKVYKYLETSHPSREVKRTAAYLRSVAEAPVLKITPQERVTVPVIMSSFYASPKARWWGRGGKAPTVEELNEEFKEEQQEQQEQQEVQEDELQKEDGRPQESLNPVQLTDNSLFWLALSLTVVGLSLALLR